MTSTLPIRLPHLSERAARSRGTNGARPAQGEGSAHAKAILFGEHAVVYGAPAIAIPIHELEAEVRVDSAEAGIRVESELFSGEEATAPEKLQPVFTAIRAALRRVGKTDSGVRVQVLSAIPHSRGLGSSAAVAAAVTRAIADWADFELDGPSLYDVVQRAEKVAHGNPSGLDARAVTADHPMRFDFGVVSEIPVGAPLHFVIADTGIAGSTAEAVGSVRSRREQRPEFYDNLIDQLARIAEQSVCDLAVGDRQAIGEKMYEAHQLLDAIGVSSTELNSLVTAAERAGSLGAKLTGGGLGGCILALAHSQEHAEEMGFVMRAAGAARTWTATVPTA